MLVRIVLPVIGCVFILLGVYHMAAASRLSHQLDDQTHAAAKVRKRIGTIFLLVGIGLLGFYWFAL
jgi:hypothetical protein